MLILKKILAIFRKIKNNGQIDIDKIYKIATKSYIKVNEINQQAKGNIVKTSDARKISFIITGEPRHASVELVKSIINYAEQGYNILFVLNKNIVKLKEYKDVNKILEYPNVTCILQPQEISLSERLTIAARNLTTEYIVLLNLLDQINRRSFIVESMKAIERSPESSLFIQPICSLNEQSNDDMKWRMQEWDIIGLSGLLFKREILLENLSNCEKCTYWIAENLLKSIPTNKISLFSKPVISVFKSKKILATDIANIWHDWKYVFLREACNSNQRLSSDECEIALNKFFITVRDIVKNFNLNLSKKGLLLSFCAISCAICSKWINSERLEEYKYLFTSIFNFDQIAKNNIVQEQHLTIVEKFIPQKNNCIAVIETEHMEDLKGSLIHLLKEKYEVIYLTKPQYYDYHFFNCMVLRALIQPASIVVSSNDMHVYITNGKRFLSLWHGLGMLKEIDTPDRSIYPMNYLTTSSRECVKGWSKSFNIQENCIFPIGSIQTDRLFDKDFVRTQRQKVRTKYNISDKEKIVFFAPTFRMGEPKYYDFGIDIEGLSSKLRENNIYIITKRHHVFKSILRDKGINTSGVENSKNGFFKVDECFDFVSLLCASDIFMTDYSSGIFYAILLDMPIVLYALDYKEYTKGPNGFMINYPADIPAIFVDRPDSQMLIKAFQDAESSIDKDKYKKFKCIHVGACDGKVKFRVLDLIKKLL